MRRNRIDHAVVEERLRSFMNDRSEISNSIEGYRAWW